MTPPAPSSAARSLALLAALLLGACAAHRAPGPAADAALDANDPFERTNRRLFALNEALDRHALEPVARGYRDTIPPAIRTNVRNVLANLRSPVVFANDVLQGQPRRAGDTAARLVINSIWGIGGLVDVAARVGIPGHNEDFGQTLAVWGVGEGPFLFIPLLGPTNPRDLGGGAVDLAFSPFTYTGSIAGFGLARAGAGTLDSRERLIEPVDDVRRTSLDPYATFRSAFRQRRNAEIANRIRPLPPSEGTNVGLGLGAEEARP